MNAKWIGAAALCALLVSTSGCTRKFEPPRRDGGTTGTNNGEADLGNEGDPCASSDECSAGLVCGEESKVCEALHDVAEGNPCTRTAECADGLYCEQATSLCAPAGDAALGDLCGATAECAAGLVCAARGFSGECVEAGENDLGEACEGSRDCVAGLGCAAPLTDPTAPPVCQAGVAGLGLPWPGEECAADETGNFRPYFEVPGDDAADFYRLPYPNDIRLEGGHPNLDGHPTPGAERLGFDVAQSTIDAVEQSQDRFGLNSWVLTRFSERVDFDTLGSAGDTASIFATVLTPDRADYGRPLSIRWKANTSRNRYICQNWLAVRPGGAWGRPLAPDTTYAVVITTGVKSVGGVAAGQDEDFAAMLAEARPSGALGDAWDAYQPLRDWIAESGTDPATIASAAVFTTGDPAAEARALAAPARDAIPAASALTLCDEGTTSPCDDGLEGDEHVRGCFGADPEFREIHGKLGLPIFQEGEAPYLTEGGGVTPTVKRTEDVCVAMTVPADAMPEAGWPVLVYAHGTGGSFRSHISDGTLDIVNSIEVDGAEVQFLTIGWDQVQHFTRRNGDDTHPDGLVFNYANPVAAKGNFLQAAADIHAVMAYVEQLDIAAADSPTGEAIRANPDQIYFLGHSQGGTSGPLALPFDTTAKGVVLSGAGAGLTLAMLGKTTPVNTPHAVQFALMETSVPSETHPILNLIQAYFDPVDPVNYGHLLGATVPPETSPKHVFHTNSPTDTYSPPAGLNAMARALRATYILPVADEIDGVPTADAPFGGNVTHEAAAYSILGRQYEADGYDGHFVLFRNATAQGDVAEFLGTAVTLGVPEIR